MITWDYVLILYTNSSTLYSEEKYRPELSSDCLLLKGTRKERGLHVWGKSSKASTSTSAGAETPDEFRCYDLPFGMNFIRRWNWTTAIPICPTFRPCLQAKNARDDGDDHGDVENGNVTSYSNDTGADKLRQRKSEGGDRDATKF